MTTPSWRIFGGPRKPRPRPGSRLMVERLEDRTVPDTTPAAMLDPNLQVSTVVSSGISQPIGIVFQSTNDFFVLEKASGQVKRVINGVVQPTPALDLPVNSASERGLLSMALHPNFPATPFAYVRWTESASGVDSTTTADVPLVGNRVDRYVWNGSTFTFDRNIVLLRSRRSDNVAVAYAQLNRTVPGMNGGWVQFAGPLSRQADWKFIETTQFGSALQQVRYPPTRAAYTPALALSQMFMLPGATYVDPDFSWRYEIGPAGTTFVSGNALGAEYAGSLWIGSARSNQQVGNNGGSL